MGTSETGAWKVWTLHRGYHISQARAAGIYVAANAEAALEMARDAGITSPIVKVELVERVQVRA